MLTSVDGGFAGFEHSTRRPQCLSQEDRSSLQQRKVLHGGAGMPAGRAGFWGPSPSLPACLPSASPESTRCNRPLPAAPSRACLSTGEAKRTCASPKCCIIALWRRQALVGKVEEILPLLLLLCMCTAATCMHTTCWMITGRSNAHSHEMGYWLSGLGHACVSGRACGAGDGLAPARRQRVLLLRVRRVREREAAEAGQEGVPRLRQLQQAARLCHRLVPLPPRTACFGFLLGQRLMLMTMQTWAHTPSPSALAAGQMYLFVPLPPCWLWPWSRRRRKALQGAVLSKKGRAALYLHRGPLCDGRHAV